MKGKWYVEDRYVDGRREYIAARKLDAERPTTADNLEYKGRYSPRRESVQDLVDLLNSGDLIT